MLIFDLESDGLLDDVTKYPLFGHLRFRNRSRRYVYNDEGDQEPIVRGVQVLQDADIICGHNVIGYDLPVPTENLSVVRTNRLGCRHITAV